MDGTWVGGVSLARILAIDPGVRVVGWAVVDGGDGVLVSCGIAMCKRPVDLAMLITQLPSVSTELGDTVICEKMTIRKNDSRCVPSVLLDVQLVGAALAAMRAYPGVPEFATPMEWKGAVPKNIHQARILDNLSETERAMIDFSSPRESIKHNIIDAVGIAKWRYENGQD